MRDTYCVPIYSVFSTICTRNASVLTPLLEQPRRKSPSSTILTNVTALDEPYCVVPDDQVGRLLRDASDMIEWALTYEIHHF